MKFSFYKGCFIPIRQPHIEKVAAMVLPEIGVYVEPIPDFTCCPEPVGVSIPHKFTGMIISARNIALAEEKGHDIITLCNGCTYTLKQVNEQLKQDKETRARVNAVLKKQDLEYKGSIKVMHFAQVIIEKIGLEKIRNKIERPLTGLKVASHTGCHIVSPFEVMKFDDPQNPVKLDMTMNALGAESLDYKYKTQCCGWTLSNYGDRVSSNRLLEDKLNAMKKAGSDSINVICPQCLAQLDTGQMIAARQLKLDFRLPVLNYLQYLAITLGYTLDEVGYINHRVKDSGFEGKIGDILS